MTINRRQLLFTALTPLLAGRDAMCEPRTLPTEYTDSRGRVWRLSHYPGMTCAFCNGPRPFPPYVITKAPDGAWAALPELIRRIEASA